MESYGIPTAPYTLAKSAEEAASAAEKLGYPVVMKVSRLRSSTSPITAL